MLPDLSFQVNNEECKVYFFFTFLLLTTMKHWTRILCLVVIKFFLCSLSMREFLLARYCHNNLNCLLRLIFWGLFRIHAPTSFN